MPISRWRRQLARQWQGDSGPPSICRHASPLRERLLPVREDEVHRVLGQHGVRSKIGDREAVGDFQLCPSAPTTAGTQTRRCQPKINPQRVGDVGMGNAPPDRHRDQERGQDRTARTGRIKSRGALRVARSLRLHPLRLSRSLVPRAVRRRTGWRDRDDDVCCCVLLPSCPASLSTSSPNPADLFPGGVAWRTSSQRWRLRRR